jgi:hypothetical protein
MSIIASDWAWSMALGGTAGNVLGALARFADDTGYCFPSIRTLADMCNVDERTVQRINRKFIAEEYMFVERRFRPNGSPTSNGYRLNFNKQPPPPRCRRGRGENDAGVVTRLSGGGWQPCHQGGDNSAGVTTTEPSIDPSPQPLRPAQEPRGQASASNELRSGLCFSKNVSLTLQDALIRLFAGLPLEHAQQVLDELTGQMKSTHVRDPVRYCARLVERFKRGEFQLDRGWAVARDRQASWKIPRAPHEIPTAINAPASPPRSRMPDSFRDVMERIRNGPPPRHHDANAGIGDLSSDDAESDPD